MALDSGYILLFHLSPPAFQNILRKISHADSYRTKNPGIHWNEREAGRRDLSPDLPHFILMNYFVLYVKCFICAIT